MSTRVYLSENTCPTTPEETTPVCIRIQLSRATIKDLHHRLQQAYRRDEARLVRRITVLIDLLVHDVPDRLVGDGTPLSAFSVRHTYEGSASRQAAGVCDEQ
jgi:hypothetical protein